MPHAGDGTSPRMRFPAPAVPSLTASSWGPESGALNPKGVATSGVQVPVTVTVSTPGQLAQAPDGFRLVGVNWTAGPIGRYLIGACERDPNRAEQEGGMGLKGGLATTDSQPQTGRARQRAVRGLGAGSTIEQPLARRSVKTARGSDSRQGPVERVSNT